MKGWLIGNLLGSLCSYARLPLHACVQIVIQRPLVVPVRDGSLPEPAAVIVPEACHHFLVAVLVIEVSATVGELLAVAAFRSGAVLLSALPKVQAELVLLARLGLRSSGCQILLQELRRWHTIETRRNLGRRSAHLEWLGRLSLHTCECLDLVEHLCRTVLLCLLGHVGEDVGLDLNLVKLWALALRGLLGVQLEESLESRAIANEGNLLQLLNQLLNFEFEDVLKIELDIVRGRLWRIDGQHDAVALEIEG